MSFSVADSDSTPSIERVSAAEVLVDAAKLVLAKSVDQTVAYVGSVLTYSLSVKNTGTLPADDVVLTDLLPAGLSLVAGSLVVSVPYSGTLATGLTLTGPVAPGQTVTLSFQAKVDAMPLPNPVANLVTATYTYTVGSDIIAATAASNTASTLVFRYHFSQQVSDLIESVALEQAALAAIAQAEGAKIQKIVTMDGATTQELLCLNKSVSDLLDSIALLEAVLRQKLAIVSCQFDGESC